MSEVHLKSTSGARIDLTFDKTRVPTPNQKNGERFMADNLQVTVARPDLGPEDSVKLVVVNNTKEVGTVYDPTHYKQWDDVFALDLAPAEPGTFRAELPDVQVGELADGFNAWTQQRVSVRINDEWQKDPIQNNAPEFNVNLLLTP